MSKERSITNLAFNKATFIKFSEGIAKRYSYDIAVLLAIFMELEEMFETAPELENFFKATKGYFYCMAKYVHKRNGMSDDRMRRAVNKMESSKLIYTKKWARNWKLYKINHKELSPLLLAVSIENLENKKGNTKYFSSKLKDIEDIANLL